MPPGMKFTYTYIRHASLQNSHSPPNLARHTCYKLHSSTKFPTNHSP